MYLPNDVWTSPQFASNYFLSIDDRSPTIIEAIAQWFSDVFTAVVKWLNKAFTATLDWINDNWLDAANAAVQPLKEHPRVALLISALIFLGPQILLLPLLILQGVFLLVLTLLGFGVQGIIGGSPAAGYQSLCYGGNTPAASLFAILQSIGMKYHVVTLGNWVLAIVRLLAGLVFLYVVLGMTLWW